MAEFLHRLETQKAVLSKVKKFAKELFVEFVVGGHVGRHLLQLFSSFERDLAVTTMGTV